MSRLFEILVDDEIIIERTTGRQFKVVFNVTLDFGGSVSYCDMSIYNITNSTAQSAFKKGSQLGFKAGYVDNIDFIFKGSIVNVFRLREGADVITRIVAHGYNDSKNNINTTLGQGVKLPAIIKACADAMGYPLVINADDFSDVQEYSHGYTMNGDPRVYMDDLAKTNNFTYVISNGRLIVTLKDSVRDGTIFTVSRYTGMEGIPIVTEIGVDVNVRLNPKINIGGRFEVESEFASFNFSNIYFQDVPEQAGKGIYKVERLTHSGDSTGDLWSSSISGYRPLQTR